MLIGHAYWFWREGKREGEKHPGEGETWMSCLLHMP